MHYPQCLMARTTIKTNRKCATNTGQTLRKRMQKKN